MPSLLEKPQLGHSQVRLRPYQEDAIAAIRGEFARKVRSTLLVLPTGLGKTVVFGSIARKTIEKGNRVLILAHRLELIEQASQKLDMLGVTAEIEMADQCAKARFDDPDCVVATVQSLQRKRLLSWPQDYFSLIITDEAHHATSESYKSIYKHFHRARHLGVTATADRADKTGLDSIAYEVTLWDAMTAPPPGPYLCRLLFCQRDVAIDLTGLRTKKGDYTDADLEKILGPMVEVLANAIKQEIGERRTIVFTPGVKSAEGLASALKSIGVRAESISGDDPDRADKIDRLKQGVIQVIVNCAVLTEGFDCPEVSAVVLCRPTKSRSLYAQMIGRGTRISPGKENCLVIDFDYLTAKHDLVKPADLFGLHPKVAKAVSESAVKDQQLDLLESVAKATKQVERSERLRIEAEEKKVEYRFKNTFDPLDYSSVVIGSDYAPPANATAKMASTKQQELLAKIGINPTGVTRDQASYFIGHQRERWDKGLSTPKQIKCLIRSGIAPAEARNMTVGQAGEQLDRIFGGRAKTAS
jgi:superfamily II DNA or RNA helicase